MDRQDLAFAEVALLARIRDQAPALDVLALEEGVRLQATAIALRRLANGYSPIERAADQLEEISQFGAKVLNKPAHDELGLAVESLAKLIRERPMNRRARRADEAERERQDRRIKRNPLLADMAKANAKETKH